VTVNLIILIINARLSMKHKQLGLMGLIVLMITFVMTAAGCLQVQPQPSAPPTSVTSWGPLGGIAVSSGTTCTGHQLLSGSSATITDACFTGTADIVLCTDTSAANPVMCTPGAGYLTIGGTPGDTIAYGRLR
jgi:hypothetical protein